MKYLKRVFLSLAVIACCSSVSVAQTESRIQSKARPFGLEIVDKVMIGGSDGRSAEFNSTGLPYFQNLINTNLSETKSLPNVESMALDPSRLQLATDYDVRVYFVGEGAGYRNTLGFSLDGPSVTSPSAKLIFPDVSSSQSYYDPATGRDTRTQTAPLLAGDFVDLGTINAGEQLDFFLIANGVNGGKNVWTADASKNPDKMRHVVAFAQPGTSYLLIGFEDLYGGGDLDYNDALIVVDIGSNNINRLTGSPEPSTMLSAGLMGGIGALVARRRKQKIGLVG